YFVYLLTVGGALFAHASNRMPGHRAGDFTLGRWFMVVAVSALLFTIGVVVIALAPQEGHVAGRYLLGAEVVGLLWYLAYLRPRPRLLGMGRHWQGVHRLHGPGVVEQPRCQRPAGDRSRRPAAQ